MEDEFFPGVAQAAVAGEKSAEGKIRQVREAGRGSAGGDAQKDSVLMQPDQGFFCFWRDTSGGGIHQRAVNVKKDDSNVGQLPSPHTADIKDYTTILSAGGRNVNCFVDCWGQMKNGRNRPGKEMVMSSKYCLRFLYIVRKFTSLVDIVYEM